MARTSSKDETVTMADAAALNGADESPAVDESPAAAGTDPNAPINVRYEDGEDGEPFVSEGMRHDLFINGKAVDPSTGRVVVLA